MARDKQLENIINGLDELVSSSVLKLSTNVQANLIETTPVDLGWARANWFMSKTVPYIVDIYHFDPTPANVARATLKATANALRVTASYSLSDGSVFITNNVPYINRLNHGHSKQAPPGFVQRAIEAALRDL